MSDASRKEELLKRISRLENDREDLWTMIGELCKANDIRVSRRIERSFERLGGRK